MPDRSPASVDLIIAAHNEEFTIEGPVRAALNSPSVRKVIVVDDCSTDRTAEVAEHAGARVVRREGEGSKALAMREGLRASDAELIMFCDADLIDLSPVHLEAVAEPVIRGEATLSIGVIDYGRLLNDIFLRLPPISGFRAMPRSVFEAIPEEKIRGFQIEIMINEVVARRSLPFALRTLLGCRHRTKRDKVGFVRGWASQLRMIFQLLSCLRVVPVWTYGAFLENLSILPPAGTEPGALKTIAEKRSPS